MNHDDGPRRPQLDPEARSNEGDRSSVGGLLSDAVRVPVTAAMLLTALIVSLAKFNGYVIDDWTVSEPYFYSQPWRLFLSAFPHGDPLHLLFNLYWTWHFGRITERYLGSWRTALLFLTLGVFSSAAEYALFSGGIGLSGIGYGLFGFLWMRESVDPRLRGAVDAHTAILFGGWFVLCIVLTMTGTWNVGNVAHAGGALVGALIGKRLKLGTAAALVLIAVGATVARPYIEQGGERGADFAYRAYGALVEGDNLRAKEWFREALELGESSAGIWKNYGIACYRLKDYAEALRACEEAEERERGIMEPEFLEWLRAKNGE